jgi:hypothetical protein
LLPHGSPKRLRWWREVVYVLVFYGVYTTIRNTFGSAGVSPRHALNNARHVIRWERAVGLFHEETIQRWFLSWRHFIQFWNVYYGSAHFIVTATALILMFRRMPQRYPRFRNTLMFTTGLALLGFAFYPLMPPRLLDECGRYGACLHYGFVDTLKDPGGLWSFDSGAMAKVSNQYAAMPSLHCAWATWSSIVLWPMVRRPWAKALVIAYPLLTVFCIVVTANHYLLDAVGGLVVLGAGYVLGAAVARHMWELPETAFEPEETAA